jgi:hypothetical protein
MTYLTLTGVWSHDSALSTEPDLDGHREGMVGKR